MTFIQTYTGRLFDILHPTPKMVDIQDIAHALSQINRFGGHTKYPYSVAQHSVLVSYICPERLALIGLLHDAAEAYVGDIVRPIKRALLVQEDIPCGDDSLGFAYHVERFEKIEENVHSVICEALGLLSFIPGTVSHADQVALATEFRDLFDQPAVDDWIKQFPDPHPVQLSQWTVRDAKEMFLTRYEELCTDRNQLGLRPRTPATP